MNLRIAASILLSLGTAVLAAPSAPGAGCLEYDDYIRWIGGSTTGAGKPGVAYGYFTYVSPSGATIRAYDTSEPLLPVPGALLDCGGNWIVSTERSGATLFVGTLSGVCVVSLAAPMAPVVVANIPGQYPLGLRTVGNTLYVAWNWERLDLYDVSIPASPALVTSITLPGAELVDVAVVQGYAYVGTANGVRIIDVEPAASAHQVGMFGTGLYASLIAEGGRLYAGGESISLRIYNLAFPTAPSLVGSVGTAASEVRAVVDERAYLSTSEGLMIVDTSAPGSPLIRTLAAGMLAPTSGEHLLVRPGHLFYQGLQVFDTSGSWQSPPVALVEPSFPATQASALHGDKLFVAAGGAGLRVYDLVAGEEPVLSATLPSIQASDVSVSWPLVCVGTPTGLSIVDAGTPGELEIVGTALPGTNVRTVASSPGRAYAGTAAAIYGFDLSNPATPVQIGLYQDCLHDYTDLHVAGSTLYAIGTECTTNFNSGMVVLDVSVPGVWTPAGVVSYVESFTAVGAVGYACAILMQNGLVTGRELWEIDLSNPLNPEVGAQVPVRAGGQVLFDDGALYLTTNDIGVEVFDVSVPSSPVSVGQSIPIDGASQAAVYGDELYITSIVGGLTVLAKQCSPTANAPEANVSPRLLGVKPNPTIGGCRVSFDLPLTSPIAMTVHDVAGRIVTQQHAGTLSAGRHELVWDARGANGQLLPAGVYFATVRGGGVEATARLVLRR